MIQEHINGLLNCADWIKEHAEEIIGEYDRTRKVVITIEPGDFPLLEIRHEVVVVKDA